MQCDGSPDPAMPQEINTFMSLWQENKNDDIEFVIEKGNKVLNVSIKMMFLRFLVINSLQIAKWSFMPLWLFACKWSSLESSVIFVCWSFSDMLSWLSFITNLLLGNKEHKIIGSKKSLASFLSGAHIYNAYTYNQNSGSKHPPKLRKVCIKLQIWTLQHMPSVEASMERSLHSYHSPSQCSIVLHGISNSNSFLTLEQTVYTQKHEII